MIRLENIVLSSRLDQQPDQWEKEIAHGFINEYGINDMYLGIPVKLGKEGISKKIELQLNDDEMGLLNQSAAAVKGVMDSFNAMGLI